MGETAHRPGMFTYGDTFELLGLTWRIQDIRDWEDQDTPRAERATVIPLTDSGDWDRSQVLIGRGRREGVRLLVHSLPDGKLGITQTSASADEFTGAQRALINQEMLPLLDLPQMSPEEEVERQVSFMTQLARSAAGDVGSRLFRVPLSTRKALATRITSEMAEAFHAELSRHV